MIEIKIVSENILQFKEQVRDLYLSLFSEEVSQKKRRKPKSEVADNHEISILPQVDNSSKAVTSDDSSLQTLQTLATENHNIWVEPKPKKEVTRDVAKDALRDLNSKKGIEVAKAVLNQFKCQRFNEIKDSDLEKFVDICEKASI